MVKPFTPDEAKQAKEDQMPDAVFEVVNEMLAKEYTGSGRVVLKQGEVVSNIAAKMGISRNAVFDRKLLDFEPHYRRAGWTVNYDKPAYNESYEAFWEFSRRSTNG